jgi:hypothetical protein
LCGSGLDEQAYKNSDRKSLHKPADKDVQSAITPKNLHRSKQVVVFWVKGRTNFSRNSGNRPLLRN